MENIEKAKELLGDESFDKLREVYGDKFDETISQFIESLNKQQEAADLKRKRFEDYLNYKPEYKPLPGMKEIDIDGKKVWAINHKNALRKANKNK